MIRTLTSLLPTQGSGGLSVSYHQGFSGHLRPLRISVVTLCLVLSRIRVTVSQLVETVLYHLPQGELEPSGPFAWQPRTGWEGCLLGGNSSPSPADF